jgi:hypothetical protein
MPWEIGLQQGVIMQSVNELLRLFMRQARLERAMKQRDVARVAEERKFSVAVQNT